jgi:hypothetical protein
MVAKDSGYGCSQATSASLVWMESIIEPSSAVIRIEAEPTGRYFTHMYGGSVNIKSRASVITSRVGAKTLV